MQYNQPFGISDPDAPYINGDPSIGRQGSIPPAAAFEYPQREMVNLIAGNNLIPSNNDLWQMLEATRSQSANYAVDTGSVNTLSVAYNPPLGAYTLGLPLRVKVHATNNAGATIDAGAGRVGIKRSDGSNVQPGDLPANAVVDLVFDGTYFQLVNYLGGASTGAITNNFNNIPYAVDTSTTPNIITVAFTPTLPTPVAGSIIMVKIANTNIADTIMNVDAHSSMAVRANGGLRLLPGDVAAGDVKILMYDGAQWQVTPNALIPTSVTINIPSTQYPDVATTLNMLSRKTVNMSAIVTLKLGVGIFPPIKLTHKDSSNFIIAGTMLAAAPTLANFQTTGNSAAARAADAAANIIMLRARYGTEIQTNAGNGSGPGFRSYGSGAPQLQDILITGDKSFGTAGVYVDVAYPLAESTQTNNVAVWGCTWGYYSGGKCRASYGSTTNCVHGGSCNSAGQMYAVGHLSLSNDYAGYYGAINGTVILQLGCHADYNGTFGVVVGNNSTTSIQGSYISYNGTFDVYALVNSSAALSQSASSSNLFSPPLGTVGNVNSIVTSG